MIDDLGTLSSAEAGMLRLHREPADIAALSHELEAAAKASIQGAPAIRVEGSATAVAPVDSQRIRQVLENLLSNALRHTDVSGEIRIVVASDDDGITVEVRDNGRGIPVEELPHIFEHYRKADDSPGSGLGLVIARRLVEAHGGEIGATSVEGNGATLRFTIPAREPPAPEG